MDIRSYISGYGLISAMGSNAEENRASLLYEKSGISKPTYLPTFHKDLPVGEVKHSNAELAELLHTTEKSRTILLGSIAAREALANANIDDDWLKTTFFINGTSVGGMDKSEWAYKNILQSESKIFSKEFESHDCGEVSRQIGKSIGVPSNISTISTACSSAANAILMAGRYIRAGLADRVIAGGTDALSIFTLNGFNSLKILDIEWCKPFDNNRKGLNLGEGAAYLVIESEKSLMERNGKALAELTGYGNANDSYHQTASSPEGKGAQIAMQTALNCLGEGKSIDYINAHGTGTENNDKSESTAIKNVFGEMVPAFSSTKAYTGHALAPAGALEAIFSIFAIEEQMVFPALNVIEPLGIIRSPILKPTSAKIENVLSNSFGFSGNCTSLIFSRL